MDVTQVIQMIKNNSDNMFTQLAEFDTQRFHNGTDQERHEAMKEYYGLKGSIKTLDNLVEHLEKCAEYEVTQAENQLNQGE